jgi:hypothetical protein
MIEIELSEFKALKKGLKGYDKKLHTVVNKYAENQATKLADTAKDKARWTDDTGQARASITGTYIKKGYLGVIRLEGYALKSNRKVRFRTRVNRVVKRKKNWGKDYFQHLEFHHGKKYAILRPTVDKAIPRITKTLANRLGKVKILGG